jgi:Domain of unknown function (DUF4340)
VNSRTLTNLALLIFLLSLVAFIVVENTQTDTTKNSLLSELNVTDIHKLHIVKPGQPALRFIKTNNIWYMQSPFSVPANQSRISALLKITQAHSLAHYALAQVDLAQLHLNKNALTITLNEMTLRLGTTEPLSGSRYVLQGEQVHLIMDRYSHLISSASTGFVSPVLINPNASISALHFPELQLRLNDGRWQHATLPQTRMNNPDHIQQLLDEWHYARAQNIRVLDKSLPISARVQVTTQQQVLYFNLINTADEIILQRNDLGLQYHFTLDTGRRLLSLPTTSSIEK